ncbi:MAG: endolytic transglycosylase MltG [bacterium]|nr:endolytic transglycosylase MltG [bacterium]
MKAISISIVIIGFIASISLSYFFFALGAVARDSWREKFEIKAGQGLGEISSNLKTAGLIRSQYAFEIYSFLAGSAHLLKPGNYFLDAASSTPLIVAGLVRGSREEPEITIPEGFTLKDIEEILVRENILPKKALSSLNLDNFRKEYEFLAGAKSLEGYLFPDTYRFYRQSDAALVAGKFLDNFNKKAWPVLKNHPDFKEKLILASLIEKEVPSAEDRHLVSGVLMERLRQGIALRVDATIIYAKCGGLFVFCESPALVRSDLKLNSLYNTYLHPGLPPGPISNPGLGSIVAALNPQESEFLYYLSDPKTKKTIFSKTLDEHNENRALYLGL